MHLSKEKLKLLIDNRLDTTEIVEIEKHLKACEFCQEFVDNYKLLMNCLEKTANIELPQEAITLAEKLYHDAIKGKIIPLSILEPRENERSLQLAADGKQKVSPRVMNLTTLYSENPEIVLRVMHDEDKGEDYLHLISDDPSLSSNVMVQIPELDRQFITDDDGRAVIKNIELERFEHLKWQIKMPDAVFSLEPLIYDPDKTEYSKDIILTTDNNDRIKVTFEGKTEGKQIAIEILELDGSIDFGKVRVIVCHDESLSLKEAVLHKPVTFSLKDSQEKINIRLFQ